MEKTIIKIKVTASRKGCKFVTMNNGEELANVRADILHKGKYAAYCGGYGTVSGCTYKEAVEIVSDIIEFHLNKYGYDVEFIKED